MAADEADLGTAGVGVVFTSASRDLSERQHPTARADAFARLAAGIGVRVAVVSQVHGRDVVPVDERQARDEGALLDLTGQAADGLVTDVAGIALAVRVADCVPILLADEDAGVVGAAHAGRAGVLAGVVGCVADAMGRLGARHLTAWIGPHICGGCYEVPDDLADAFAAATSVPPTRTRWGTAGIDLRAAVERQLDALGADVRGVGACTLTDASLHSYRRDGATAGRQAGLIWLRDRARPLVTPRRAG